MYEYPETINGTASSARKLRAKLGKTPPQAKELIPYNEPAESEIWEGDFESLLQPVRSAKSASEKAAKFKDFLKKHEDSIAKVDKFGHTLAGTLLDKVWYCPDCWKTLLVEDPLALWRQDKLNMTVPFHAVCHSHEDFAWMLKGHPAVLNQTIFFGFGGGPSCGVQSDPDARYMGAPRPAPPPMAPNGLGQEGGRAYAAPRTAPPPMGWVAPPPVGLWDGQGL